MQHRGATGGRIGWIGWISEWGEKHRAPDVDNNQDTEERHEPLNQGLMKLIYFNKSRIKYGHLKILAWPNVNLRPPSSGEFENLECADQ